MQSRKTAAKTANRLTGVKSGPTFKPKAKAMTSTMAACMRDRITELKTFDINMEPRATGVLRSLFKMPKRLSHTIDMPLNMHVKSTMKEIIPIDMNEK